MMVEILNEDVALNDFPENRQPTGVPGEMEYIQGRSLWERVPPFTYDSPGLKWTLERQRISIAMLVIWFTATMVAMFAALSKLSVE
jgi:hypothetical protein